MTVMLLLSTGLLGFATSFANADTNGSPSEVLLGAGANWAANGGTRALFVNSYDNWMIHHDTDGVDWHYSDESTMIKERDSISISLFQSGLNVSFSGDIPQDLSNYDVVVISSYFACAPSYSKIIKDYIAGGGGVVLFAGVPEALRCYFRGTGGYGIPTDPLSVDNSDWLGFTGYVNTGGPAYFALNSPIGTEYSSGDQVMFANGHSAAAVTGANGSIIALWQTGEVFACSHEYGLGRLYYQACLEETLTKNTTPSVPTGLSHVSTTTSVTLGWNVSRLATSYNIYSGPSEDSMTLVGISNVPGFNDTSVSRGLTYYYKVSATNSMGESQKSTALKVTVLTLLHGTIVNANGIPLPGIAVSLEDGTTARTNASGGYELELSPGEHELTVSGSGIQTLKVPVTVETQGSSIAPITTTTADDTLATLSTISLIIIAIALSIIVIVLIAKSVRRDR
jgi:hypothetical protein